MRGEIVARKCASSTHVPAGMGGATAPGMRHVPFFMVLAFLAGCISESPTNGDVHGPVPDGKADEASGVPFDPEPEFGFFPAERDAEYLGSATLKDIESHVSQPSVDAVASTTNADLYSRAFFGTIQASFDAQEALGTRDVVVYLLEDRIVRFPAPRALTGFIDAPGIKFGLAELHGAADMVQQYWASYIHRAMTRAELGPHDDSQLLADMVLEMSYLAAIYYSELERLEPDYLTPELSDFMQWQMGRATQAAADAARAERGRDITELHDRAAEIRQLGKDLSPAAAELLRDFMHLPPAPPPGYPGGDPG
jgi:hypothetical protein